MRKVLSVFMSVLIVLFCSSCKKYKTENDAIKYDSGIFQNKNWDEKIGTYCGGVVIPNEQIALEIANAIFDGMNKSDEALKYVAQSVFYDVEDGIWIVSFAEDSKQITVGGDCSIAMQKSDGKVLRIWYGE